MPLADGPGHAALRAAVDAFRPQVILSAGFDRIVRSDVLDKAGLPLNIHFAALPRHRGSYSIPWAILEDDEVIGVTAHRMTPGIDDGPIIEQRFFANDRAASCRELYDKAVFVGTDLAVELVGRLADGQKIAETPQDDARASYHPPAFPNDFRVPWSRDASYVARYVRACHFPPLPAARASLGRSAVEILWPVETYPAATHARPGAIVEAVGRRWIATGHGAIAPSSVRIDGRIVPLLELLDGARDLAFE